MENALQAAARLEPDNGFVHALRGDRFRAERRWAEAAREYEAAVAADPYRAGKVVQPVLDELRVEMKEKSGAR
jgi:hypothetical protein